METRPEQQPSEIYLGNARFEDVGRSSWRTSRLGSRPLCVDGSEMDKYSAVVPRPWFIQRSEVEAAIESERFNNKPWSAERIRTYQEMLIS